MVVNRATQQGMYISSKLDKSTHGLTVTPSAQSLCEGARPLSGGGWKEPPLKESVSTVVSDLICVAHNMGISKHSEPRY